MTTNEVIETLNAKIADLTVARIGTAGRERECLTDRLVRLYNARNRLPLHTGRAA